MAQPISTTPWFDFDIRNDPVFEQIIKPIIDMRMDKLAAYDKRREEKRIEKNGPEINYWFQPHSDIAVPDDVRKTCARLGQPENVQYALFMAVKLHDIGKEDMSIDTWDSLEKPTDDVKAYRRTHTDRGLAIADEIFKDVADHPFVRLVKEIIQYHHVNIDGTGYPKGVTGNMISDPVKLICIVEGYDGYKTTRPHFGKERSVKDVLDKMRSDPDKGAKMFDMDMFDVFAAMKMEELTQNPVPAMSASGHHKEKNI